MTYPSSVITDLFCMLKKILYERSVIERTINGCVSLHAVLPGFTCAHLISSLVIRYSIIIMMIKQKRNHAMQMYYADEYA